MYIFKIYTVLMRFHCSASVAPSEFSYFKTFVFPVSEILILKIHKHKCIEFQNCYLSKTIYLYYQIWYIFKYNFSNSRLHVGFVSLVMYLFVVLHQAFIKIQSCEQPFV